MHSLINYPNIARWSLILALIATLVGCSEPALIQPTAAPTTTPSSLSPLATPTPSLESQPMIITLGLWLPEEFDPYGEGPAADVLAQQLTEFSQAHPDLQVEVTVKKAHGRGGLLDFLRTAHDAAPSVLPDLIVLEASDLETVAKSNLVQPLDTLLSPAEMTDRFPFAAELGSVEGQKSDETNTMGFVIGADMQHIAYRSDLLESPPVSWTQMISPPVSFLLPAGGRGREINDATLIQYLAAGGQLADAEGRPWLDEDVMVNVLSFYSDCISREPISPTFNTPTISPTVALDITDADQAWERFQTGEGEMTVVRAGRYWPAANENISAAPMPTHDGQPFSIARGWVVAMVTEDPARQKLATLLLNWLIRPKNNAQWTRAAGYLPGARGALRLWDVPDADRSMLRNLMESAVAAPPPEVMMTSGRAMQEALEILLRNRGDPEEATEAAIEILGQ